MTNGGVRSELRSDARRRQFLRQATSVIGLAMAGVARNAVALPPTAPARRPIAAVTVNGRGPFRFVFDSAATRSAVSGQLQYTLGLPIAEASVTVNGTLGRQRQSLAHIDHLQCGVLSLHDQQLPLLDRYALPSDDGLLGIDGLMDSCVDIDVDRMTAQVVESPAAPLSPASRVVKLLPHSSGLSMVEVEVAGIRCNAILDTGAERSVGNSALRRALQAAPGVPHATRHVPLTRERHPS